MAASHDSRDPTAAPAWAASLTRLVDRAEALLARAETLLPHPLQAPDWSASAAFRYRRRQGSVLLEPVRQIGRIVLSDLREVGRASCRERV